MEPHKSGRMKISVNILKYHIADWAAKQKKALIADNLARILTEERMEVQPACTNIPRRLKFMERKMKATGHRHNNRKSKRCLC